MGWLWRCTQDRELCLEDDLKTNDLIHMDAFSAHFPPQEKPRKGSPESRLSGMSFLDEITTEQFQGYTTEQIVTIMEQRANVLKVVNGGKQTSLEMAPKNVENQSLMSRFSAHTDTSRKGWLPTSEPGFDECQFKCCHNCRPINRDRGYISLDAVAKGEYPASAIVGYGFQIRWGHRPVHSAEIVRNLGLRPSPAPVAAPVAALVVRPKRQRITRQMVVSSSINSSPFNDEQSADTTFNQPPTAHFYDSTAMARSLNNEASRTSFSAHSSPEILKVFRNMFASRTSKGDRNTPQDPKRERHSPRKRPSTPPRRPKVTAPVGSGLARTPTLNRRHSPNKRSAQDDDNLRSLYAQDPDPETGDIGLQRTSIKALSSLPTTPTRSRPPHSHRGRTRQRASQGTKEVAAEGRAPRTPKLLTPMEEKESRGGSFSDKPLQVSHGVALTEEAVELHIPDIITQI